MRLLHSLATFLVEEAAVRSRRRHRRRLLRRRRLDRAPLRPDPASAGPRSRAPRRAPRSRPRRRLGRARRGAPPRCAARLGVECSVERRPVEPVATRRRRARGRSAPGPLRVPRGRPLPARASASSPPRTIATTRPKPCCCGSGFGSGPLGLAAIERRRGAILRPLLDLDRAELRAALLAAGIDWIEDPTNRDDARPRNRIRRLLEPLPRDLTARLASIAASARDGARSAVDRALVEALDARREFDGASASLSAMRRLPSTLVSPALATLHRQAGLPYPASRRAAAEIERQMKGGGLPDCDCGRGLRLGGARLAFAPRAEGERRTRPRSFHVYSDIARGAGGQGTFTPFPPGSCSGSPSGV